MNLEAGEQERRGGCECFEGVESFLRVGSASFQEVPGVSFVQRTCVYVRGPPAHPYDADAY